jgi:hypothetical protein
MAPFERGGVVDQSGNVWGLEGSVVGDASIIPVVPAANSILPKIMTAERIAQATKVGGIEKVGSVLARLNNRRIILLLVTRPDGFPDANAELSIVGEMIKEVCCNSIKTF